MTLSAPAIRILRVFLEDPELPHYGFEIMEAARIKSGTLYPLLDKFHRSGWVTREQEAIDPSDVGRPARRYYKLTPSGVEAARAEVASFFADVNVSGGVSGRSTARPKPQWGEA